MKKVFTNQYVLALGILAVAGGIAWYSTYNNRNWLMKRLILNGATSEQLASYPTKTVGQLRTELKKLKASA